jgi:hypothetical protein
MKKVMIVSAAVCMSLAASMSAFAGELSTQSGNEFGVTVSKFKSERSYQFDESSSFSQDAGQSFTDEQKQTKFGLDYTGTIAFDAGYFVKLNTRLAYGKEDTVTDAFGSVQPTIGYDIPVAGTMVSPYIGVGYRYRVTDDSDDGYGLTQYGSTTYIPVGVTNRLSLGANSGLETTLEYDIVLKDKQKAEFGVDDNNTGEDTGDATLNYSRSGGSGIKFSTMYHYSHFAIGPYVEYWKHGSGSMGADVGAEEKSGNSTEVGVKAALRF